MTSIRRRATFSLLSWVASFCATAGTASGQTTADTVAQFFPESLVELNRQIDEPLQKHQCFQVLATDQSGSPSTIAAAYTDGYRAVVRVLRRSTGGFEVAAEPSGLHFWGLACSIRLIDLSRSQRNVIHLSFEGRQNTVDWLFAWNGQELSNLAPLGNTDFGSPESVLRNAALLDLDGDGALDIVSQVHGSGNDPTFPPSVFRWSSGQFVSDQPVIGPWVFKRDDRTPTTDTIHFELPPAAQGPFSVLVVNGIGTVASRVENAVESARVWLNGEEVLRPSDFGANVTTIERPVTLQPVNRLEVRLAGTPGGTITVTIKVGDWPNP